MSLGKSVEKLELNGFSHSTGKPNSLFPPLKLSQFYLLMYLTLALSSFFSAFSSLCCFRHLFAISGIKGKKMASGRRYPSYPREESPENILCSQRLKEFLVILSPQFIINVRTTFIASFPSGTDIAASRLGQKS